jgi:thiol-disulfide isomerase/thioredoxin
MRSLLVALTLAGCVTTADKPALTDAAAPSGQLKTFSLELPRYPGSAPWRLADERGKVVLLDVWATWCEPCREALPLYQDLHKEFAGKGLSVLTINVDSQPAVIEPFLAEAQVALPVLLDPGALVSERELKLKLMPTSYLFDRRGKLRHTHEGFDEAHLQLLLSEIEHLLTEPAQ